MDKCMLDMEQYAALARQTAAEGCVLLENEDHTLPIQKNAHVAVFGRSAFHYYKSGEGSGGLVNTRLRLFGRTRSAARRDFRGAREQ